MHMCKMLQFLHETINTNGSRTVESASQVLEKRRFNLHPNVNKGTGEVRPLESVETRPARKIPPSRKSVTGRYITRSGTLVDFESGLERDFALLADYDPSVQSIRAQPLRIGRHVPDFYIETLHGSGIVDVKPEGTLLKRWDEDKAKYAETAEYCERQGMSYWFFTDAVRYELWNRLVVLKYVDYFGRIWVSKEEALRLAEDAISSQPIQVRDLCAKFAQPATYVERKAVTAGLVRSGRATIVDTPGDSFDDAVVSIRGSPAPISFLVTHERMVKRVNVHPLRFPSAARIDYYEGMRSLNLEGHNFTVLDSSNPLSLLAKSSECDELFRVPLHTMPAPGGKLSSLGLDDKDSEQYYEAVKRVEVIGRLASKYRLTGLELSRASSVLGVKKRQIQNLVAEFRERGPDAMIPERVGGKGRIRRPAVVQEFFWKSVSIRHDPQSEKPLTGDGVLEDVNIDIMRENKNRRPSEQLSLIPRSTMYRWMKLIPDRDVIAKTQGIQIARSMFSAHGGRFPDASYPLETVQVDHSPLDLLVKVELANEARCSFKVTTRPFLTLMVGVYSRLILGYLLNLKQPNSNQTGLLIMMCAKRWGIPWQLHTDNGKDFRARALQSGCSDMRNRTTLLSIDQMFRPLKDPRFGGTVERLIGVLQLKHIHCLPGTTKSNVGELGDYTPVNGATLNEAEICEILDNAVDNCNRTPQESLDGLSPLQRWEHGVKTYGPPQQLAREDEHHFRISFLPSVMRTVSNEGIRLLRIKFSNGSYGRFLESGNGEDRDVLVKYDPTNITEQVYVLDRKTNEFVIIGSNISDRHYHLKGWLRCISRLKEAGSEPSEWEIRSEYRKMVDGVLQKSLRRNKRLAKEVLGMRREQENSNLVMGRKAPEPTTDRDDKEVEPDDDFDPSTVDLGSVVRLMGDGRDGGKRNHDSDNRVQTPHRRNPGHSGMGQRRYDILQLQR